MAREKDFGSTLEELEEAGATRALKKDRLVLPQVVHEFLSLCIERPPEYPKWSAAKQAEIDRERLGFYKAQEKLREFIALAGINEIADLADVRDDRQIRPQLMGTMRIWLAEGE